MNLQNYFFYYCNLLILNFNSYFKGPSVIIFLLVSIILTFKTGFLQIRGFTKFLRLILNKPEKDQDKIEFKHNIEKDAIDTSQNNKKISSLKALFTAMATTIGVGNIIGPSMAIKLGGPGALFWLIAYIFLSSATKFVEVTFSVYSRKISKNGDIIGGPSQYLNMVSPIFSYLYAALTMILFTIWSGVQVNTISCIASCEGVSPIVTGIIVVFILLFAVFGGINRVGIILSKLVPFIFTFYVSFALYVIFKNISMLPESLKLILDCAFSTKALCGGTAGITILTAIKEGIYKSIFITEAGLGTGSIAHSFADVKKPTDQGILAMFSSIANIVLCSLSGLITIITGLHKEPNLSSEIIYKAFKLNCPIYGIQYFLLLSISLFAVSSLIGDAFNGGQNFAALFGYKRIKLYFILTSIIAFVGSIIQTPFIWNLMDLVTSVVAVFHLAGLLFLAFRYFNIIKI